MKAVAFALLALCLLAGLVSAQTHNETDTNETENLNETERNFTVSAQAELEATASINPNGTFVASVRTSVQAEIDAREEAERAVSTLFVGTLKVKYASINATYTTVKAAYETLIVTFTTAVRNQLTAWQQRLGELEEKRDAALSSGTELSQRVAAALDFHAAALVKLSIAGRALEARLTASVAELKFKAVELHLAALALTIEVKENTTAAADAEIAHQRAFLREAAVHVGVAIVVAQYKLNRTKEFLADLVVRTEQLVQERRERLQELANGVRARVAEIRAEWQEKRAEVRERIRMRVQQFLEASNATVELVLDEATNVKVNFQLGLERLANETRERIKEIISTRIRILIVAETGAAEASVEVAVNEPTAKRGVMATDDWSGTATVAGTEDSSDAAVISALLALAAPLALL